MIKGFGQWICSTLLEAQIADRHSKPGTGGSTSYPSSQHGIGPYALLFSNGGIIYYVRESKPCGKVCFLDSALRIKSGYDVGCCCYDGCCPISFAADIRTQWFEAYSFIQGLCRTVVRCRVQALGLSSRWESFDHGLTVYPAVQYGKGYVSLPVNEILKFMVYWFYKAVIQHLTHFSTNISD